MYVYILSEIKFYYYYCLSYTIFNVLINNLDRCRDEFTLDVRYSHARLALFNLTYMFYHELS